MGRAARDSARLLLGRPATPPSDTLRAKPLGWPEQRRVEPQTAGDAVGDLLGQLPCGKQPEEVPGTHTGSVGELVPREGLAGPEPQKHALKGCRRQSGVRHRASFLSVDRLDA